VQGVEYEAKNLHDVDVLSYFPDGNANINGVIECLIHVFDNDEVDDLLDKMTVEELLEVWEEWSKQSNFEFVYRRVYDVMSEDRQRKVKLGFWLFGAWALTGVVAIVAIIMLVI